MTECPSTVNVQDKPSVQNSLVNKLHIPNRPHAKPLPKPKPQKAQTEDSEDSSFEATLPKKKYCRISNQKRIELINCVKNKGENIMQVAKRLHINYSSAKSIFKVFKEEGRTDKKTSKKNVKENKGNETEETNLEFPVIPSNVDSGKELEVKEGEVKDQEGSKPQEEPIQKEGLLPKKSLVEVEEKTELKEDNSNNNMTKKEQSVLMPSLQNLVTQINSNVNNQILFPQVITGPVSQPTLVFITPNNAASYMQFQQQQNIPNVQLGSYINGQSIIGNGQSNVINFPGQFNSLASQSNLGALGALGTQLAFQQPQMRILNGSLYSGNNGGDNQQGIINSQIGNTVNSNPNQVYYQLGNNVSLQNQQMIVNYPQYAQSPMYVMTTPSMIQPNFSVQNLNGNVNNFGYQPNGYIVIKGGPSQFQLSNASQQGQ